MMSRGCGSWRTLKCQNFSLGTNLSPCSFTVIGRWLTTPKLWQGLRFVAYAVRPVIARDGGASPSPSVEPDLPKVFLPPPPPLPLSLYLAPSLTPSI